MSFDAAPLLGKDNPIRGNLDHPQAFESITNFEPIAIDHYGALAGLISVDVASEVKAKIRNLFTLW